MCGINKRNLILAARCGRLARNIPIPTERRETVWIRCDNSFANFFYLGENLGGCSQHGIIKDFEEYREYVLSPYGTIQLCLPCTEKIKEKTSAESLETNLETDIKLLHKECEAYQSMTQEEIKEEFSRRHGAAIMAHIVTPDDDTTPDCIEDNKTLSGVQTCPVQ